MKRILVLGLLLSGCGLLSGLYEVQVEAALPKGADGVRWLLRPAGDEGNPSDDQVGGGLPSGGGQVYTSQGAGVVLAQGEVKAEKGRAQWVVPAYKEKTVLEVFARSKEFPIAFDKVDLDANSAGRKATVSPVRGRVEASLEVSGFQDGDNLYVYVPEGLEEDELKGAPTLTGWKAVGEVTSLDEPLRVPLAPMYRFRLKRGGQLCSADTYSLTDKVQMVEEALRQGGLLSIPEPLRVNVGC